MDTVKVSVVIPTLNRREFLKEAIDSVLDQTFQDFKLIVVDDGSTDDTNGLVKDYKNTKIKYICQDTEGPASARNMGIKISKGTYIAFLDSDDTWEKDKLEIQVSAMDNNPECLFSHTEEIWYKKGKRINPKEKHKKHHGEVFEQSVKLCAISMSTVMVKRELFDRIGLFDENMKACEDYDFWLRVTARFPVLLVDKELTVKQAGHDDQVSQSVKCLDKYRIYALEKIINSGLLDEEKKKLATEELINKCKIYSKGCIKHKKLDEGRYYFDLMKKYSDQDSST